MDVMDAFIDILVIYESLIDIEISVAGDDLRSASRRRAHESTSARSSAIFFK